MSPVRRVERRQHQDHQQARSARVEIADRISTKIAGRKIVGSTSIPLSAGPSCRSASSTP
jgi:hypothetical protein